MSELKTVPTQASVTDFINSLPGEVTRADCFKLVEMFKQASGEEPQMWGKSIVGFGSYRYASGQEGIWLLAGFSPRKQNITVYFLDGFEKYEEQLGKLGKYSSSKSCLYLKRLSDVDLDILDQMICQSVEHMRSTNPPA